MHVAIGQPGIYLIGLFRLVELLKCLSHFNGEWLLTYFSKKPLRISYILLGL